jgi:hypothetical protein
VCKDAVNRDFLFIALSEDFALRRFRFSVSLSDDRAIPSGRPSDHCSISPDDVPYRPNAIQTKHHSSKRRALPSGPTTVLRRFYLACIRPDVSAARPDTSWYSTSLRFFPSSDKGKIVQPSGRSGIPSRRKLDVNFKCTPKCTNRLQ